MTNCLQSPTAVRGSEFSARSPETHGVADGCDLGLSHGGPGAGGTNWAISVSISPGWSRPHMARVRSSAHIMWAAHLDCANSASVLKLWRGGQAEVRQGEDGGGEVSDL